MVSNELMFSMEERMLKHPIVRARAHETKSKCYFGNSIDDGAKMGALDSVSSKDVI